MDNSIKSLISRMLANFSPFKILFMGLAKNTGKTTALNYFLLNIPTNTNRPLFLLSTGYDGEERDAINGQPKPKIAIIASQYFITAENIIYDVNKNCKILNRFKIFTPFGEIILAVALESMNIALVSAGHNYNIQQIILFVQNRFKDAIFLIDGSLNRKSFLSIADSNDFVILSTGNAYSTNIDNQIKQLEYYHKLFSIPQFNDQITPLFISLLDETFILTTKNKNIVVSTISSIFLKPEQFTLLIQNNKIFYIQVAPKLILFTFNPFNAFSYIVPHSSKMVNLIQSHFKDIPVVDINQL